MDCSITLDPSSNFRVKQQKQGNRDVPSNSMTGSALHKQVGSRDMSIMTSLGQQRQINSGLENKSYGMARQLWTSLFLFTVFFGK